jgi:hypothetical protein
MKVSLTTAVWGPWHVDAFLRATLPTLLADGNLPALARAHDCSYRIFTTKVSAERLDRTPGMARLHQLMPVEIRVMAQDDSLSSDVHLIAWEHAVEVAVAEGAAIVSVHPDTPWSNGSFAFMARALTEGKEVFVVPNVRAISETFVPALEALRTDDAIELSGIDMSILALKHLHPLSASMIPQIGYSASATEVYWGVPGEGLCLRHASRPAIAAIPRKVPLDTEFYTRSISNWEGVFNTTDVSQMLMISLAPLFKDFGLLTPGHEVTPLLLGKWCAHPQNDTPLKDYFAAQSLRLPIKPQSDNAIWQWAERAADAFMSETSADLAAVNLYYTLRRMTCKTAAGILAMALHETNLAQGLQCPSLGPQGVVIVPGEEAFAQFGNARLAELLAPGNETRLVEFLLRHYRPDWDRAQAEQEMARIGVSITEVDATDKLSVLVIDRVLPDAQ